MPTFKPHNLETLQKNFDAIVLAELNYQKAKNDNGEYDFYKLSNDRQLQFNLIEEAIETARKSNLTSVEKADVVAGAMFKVMQSIEYSYRKARFQLINNPTYMDSIYSKLSNSIGEGEHNFDNKLFYLRKYYDLGKSIIERNEHFDNIQNFNQKENLKPIEYTEKEEEQLKIKEQRSQLHATELLGNLEAIREFQNRPEYTPEKVQEIEDSVKQAKLVTYDEIVPEKFMDEKGAKEYHDHVRFIQQIKIFNKDSLKKVEIEQEQEHVQEQLKDLAQDQVQEQAQEQEQIQGQEKKLNSLPRNELQASLASIRLFKNKPGYTAEKLQEIENNVKQAKLVNIDNKVPEAFMDDQGKQRFLSHNKLNQQISIFDKSNLNSAIVVEKSSLAESVIVENQENNIVAQCN